MRTRGARRRAGIGSFAASSSKYAGIIYLILATRARSAIPDTSIPEPPKAAIFYTNSSFFILHSSFFITSMSLFEKYFKTIEDAIQRMGVDPKTCRTDEQNKWFLHRGTADVVVFMRESMMYNDTRRYTVVILSPIFLIRPDMSEELRNKLNLHLLEVNHKFITERFSIDQDVVFISCTAFMDDITDSSLAVILDSQSFYAQAFAQDLQKNFGPVEAEE
jgi:hypothetical protein